MIKSKLSGNRGATLIFALVALMVATMVSAVIIYAAESNVRRIRADQAAEQARLTLNSAAAVIRNEISGDRFDTSYTVQTTTVTRDSEVKSQTEGTPVISNLYMQNTSTGGAESWSEKYNTDGPAGVADTRTSIEKTIYDWVEKILQKQDTDTTSSLKCETDFYITADNMDEVKVTLSMQPGALMDQTEDVQAASNAQKYYITAVVTLSDPTAGAEKIVMTFMANDPVEQITSTPVSTSSETKTDEDGTTTYVESTTVLSVKKELSIRWDDEKVVVNIVN